MFQASRRLPGSVFQGPAVIMHVAGVESAGWCVCRRFLLTDEQLDANTAWGPPRLATIAAAVLHRSLVADLKAIQAAQQPQQLAEVLVMPDAPSAATAQQQVAPPPPAQGPVPTSGSPVEEAGSTTTTSSSAAQRRRWRRSGHQRSNSDAARWVGRLSDITPRAPLSVRRLSTGGLGRVSRRGRASSPGAAPPLVAPGGERINLQDALGQLSPRAIVAALVGGGADDAGGNSSSAAAGPASAAGSPPCGTSGREELCSPSTGSTWRRLVTRQVRLGGTRQQQQQSSCASPDPEDCCPHQHGCADEPGQADHKAPGSLVRSASDSFCLVLGDEAEWQKFADAAGLGGGEGDRQPGSSQAAKEVEEIPAVFDSGKVSPFPELKPDVPGTCNSADGPHHLIRASCAHNTACTNLTPTTHHCQRVCSVSTLAQCVASTGLRLRHTWCCLWEWK